MFDALTIDKSRTFSMNFRMSRRISGIFLGYLEYLTCFIGSWNFCNIIATPELHQGIKVLDVLYPSRI